MPANDNDRPSTSQRMLSRLAERTPAVLDRNRTKSSMIAAFADTLPANANAFHAQYADVDLFAREVSRLGAAANAQVEALSQVATGWSTPLSQHMADFDVLPLTRNSVPSDVLNQSEQLLDRVRFIAADPERAPTYVEAVIGELELVIDQTRTALQAWREAKVELQERRRGLRQRAVRFEAELIAFRTILRRVLGYAHHDYQYLRTRRLREELVVLPTEPANDVTPDIAAEPDGTDTENAENAA